MVKNLLATERDTENAGLILSWEDPLEEEMATPPVFLPQNPMDRGALVPIVHGITKSRTLLSD